MTPEMNNKEQGTDAGKLGMPIVQIDEWDLTGLSALLTFAPGEPVAFGERRTGRDRRVGDRRAMDEA
jgi:hypothetical protein